ncbi:hypothetical protein EVAR_27870_1 [Eumeta japonica]|uniref:Uncharacterized protein n=1 Tax=Eumeta variegata TaxID=151549 RepID=A0A4C1VJV9_EUMVA|nr:hypothetical protein EVAR_27870_1 [Eumeta japonica]
MRRRDVFGARARRPPGMRRSITRRYADDAGAPGDERMARHCGLTMSTIFTLQFAISFQRVGVHRRLIYAQRADAPRERRRSEGRDFSFRTRSRVKYIFLTLRPAFKLNICFMGPSTPRTTAAAGRRDTRPDTTKEYR